MGTLHGSALAQLGRQCDVAVAAAPLDDVEQNADTGFTHGGHGLAEGGEHGVDVFRNTDAVDGDDGAIAYWLNFKPEADATLQKVAAMYTEKTGVPVTVVTAASGTYNETLT